MKKLISLLLLICIMLPLCVPSVSGYEKLPAPDWVTVISNADYSKTVIIKTPTYMLEYIDCYEYSTDGFLTKEQLDKSGGEFVFDKTTEFSLRYISYGIESETYTVTVEINKITVVTSDSANISVLIPFDSPVPANITLSAYEIVSGTAHTKVQEILGEKVSFRFYNTSVMLGGKPYSPDVPLSYLFPCDDLDARFCKIYTVDESGKLSLIESKQEMNMRLCETDKTGFFIVAEDKAYRKGDLNGDGEVLADDARIALRIAAQLENASTKQVSAGDINKNNSIDAADARSILRAAAKLDNL